MIKGQIQGGSVASKNGTQAIGNPLLCLATEQLCLGVSMKGPLFMADRKGDESSPVDSTKPGVGEMSCHKQYPS